MFRIFAAAAVAVLAAGCGGQAPRQTSPSATASPPGAPALSEPEKAFIADMRGQFSFSGSVDDDRIALFGGNVCKDRRGGVSQAAEASAAREVWSNTGAPDATAMVRLAEQDLCPSYLPKQAWHTVATFTGSGDTSTSRFTIGGDGDWVLRYSYDCSGQMGGTGNFIVSEDAMSNSTPSAVEINRLDSGAKGSWHVYGDAGSHYLEIQTECPYTLRVRQKY